MRSSSKWSFSRLFTGNTGSAALGAVRPTQYDPRKKIFDLFYAAKEMYYDRGIPERDNPTGLKDTIEYFHDYQFFETNKMLDVLLAVVREVVTKHYPFVVGNPIVTQGVSWGKIVSPNGKSVNLELIPDMLRDPTGRPVEMTCERAIDYVTQLNRAALNSAGIASGTTKFGNGYEAALTNAVAEGKLEKGFLIVARAQDLHKISRECEKNPDLAHFNNTITPYCVSCTENNKTPTEAFAVGLKGGDTKSVPKGAFRPDAIKQSPTGLVVLRVV